MRCSLVALMFVVACGAENRQSVALYDKGDYAGAARAADTGLAAHPADDGLWQMKIRAAVALGDGDAVARAWTAYAATGDAVDKDLLRDLAIATLGQALANDAAPAVQIRAIDAVAESELHPLAEQVADHLHDEHDPVAAAAAAAVLRGFPEAPAVAEKLEHSADAQARRIVFEAIGKKVGKLALADFEKAASDKDAGVRRIAIRWLGQLKDADAHEVLVKRQRDPDEGVRAAAAIALARIGTGNLGELAKRAEADRALEVQIAAVDLYVAAHATPELQRLATDPKVPAMVALAAGIELKAAAGPFARALADEDWTHRAGALNEGVRAVGKDAARDAATKLLAGDPELGVKLTAARVLLHTGGDRTAAIAVFATALAMPDRALAAAEDLADAGDPRGDETLAKLVRDREQPAGARALAAAAHRASHRVTAGLVAALTDPSPDVRVEAAAALAVLSK